MATSSASTEVSVGTQTYSLVFEHNGAAKAFTVPTIPPITDIRSVEARRLMRLFEYDFPGNFSEWVPDSDKD